LIQVASDIFDDLTSVPKYPFVRVAEDPVTGTHQDVVALLVSSNLLVMDFTVHFDDQLLRQANEIDNESIDGVLPAKPPTQPMSTDSLPQRLLGGGRLRPHPLSFRLENPPQSSASCFSRAPIDSHVDLPFIS
jgi:hypothetical protein